MAPGIDVSGGQHRATANVRVIYQPPASSGARAIASRRFSFVAPLGPIETEEIAWYLERYPQWPSGFFDQRAREVEGKLAAWGQLLAEPFLGATTRDAFETWNRLPPEVDFRNAPPAILGCALTTPKGFARSAPRSTQEGTPQTPETAMKPTFSANVWQVGDCFVAQCLEADIASQGRSEDKALANLREALELHSELPTATVFPRLQNSNIEELESL